MAPLKFRAWHLTEKKMYFSELHDNHGTSFNLYDWGKDNESWEIERTTVNEKLGTVLVRSSSGVLMQSTGLHDKNGKEIFEGDWVIGEEFNNWKERGLVLWYRNWCGFGIDWDYMSNMPLVDNRRFGEQDNKLEVIGNIHEHPHLLPPQ